METRVFVLNVIDCKNHVRVDLARLYDLFKNSAFNGKLMSYASGLMVEFLFSGLVSRSMFYDVGEYSL